MSDTDTLTPAADAPAVTENTYTARPDLDQVVAAQFTAAAGLDQWLDTHIRNTAYSRDGTVWNRIFAGVTLIKDALATIDSKEA
ncbi:hypothetical protein [Nitrospirillum viridazoti]|uniref:Uncharacterized protein n=1 Tax=Nitrospirillum amazonense TaxID=28077 RepID=A0A560IK64_9PROT|nr:hypothetical protein [Nitrospirillum amazonense]TWB58681.1 hypothetical protein FBZ92_109174 [Nitrospirillum amazonense]